MVDFCPQKQDFLGVQKKATGKRRQMASRLLLVFLDGKKAVREETNRAGNLRKSWSFVYQRAVQVQSQSCKPSSLISSIRLASKAPEFA